jgi:hypothetical protein
MKGLREIFTVEAGCYSDHAVLGVFSDEATAAQWCEAIKTDPDGWHRDAWVGRILLVESGVKPTKVTRWMQHVELWDDGRTETKGPQSQTEYAIATLWGLPPKRPKVRYVRAPVHNDKGGRLEVVGDSERVVVKVVSERIAMWKSGAWAGRGHGEINE